jgi:hypothetical protein
MTDVISGIIGSLTDIKKRISRLELIAHHHPLYETLITAASVTLTNGTTGNHLDDLQVANDEMYYIVSEVAGGAGVPGINLTVHFTSVTYFKRVKIIGTYMGSSSHAIAVQLYNWVTAHWESYNSLQDSVADFTHDCVILDNPSFNVTSCKRHIGTGANLGKVDVRFYHTMDGSANHWVALDVVALVK